ncbi:MAG: hypothetical protein V1800_06895 [Candidatus Latescibacterota bacterium]
MTEAGRRWRLGVHAQKGICSLGLDSEGSGRERTNLLIAPVSLAWKEADILDASWCREENEAWIGTISTTNGHGAVTWTVYRDRDDLVWQLEYYGAGTADGLCVTLPFSALLAAVVLIPAKLDSGKGRGPWLLVAPDFGHLLVEVASDVGWVGINSGTRGYSAHNAPESGLDPRLKGAAWIEAAQLPDYRPGRLDLCFCAEEPVASGTVVTFRFSPVEMTTPQGIDEDTWRRIRRPYLNHWQPCGTWTRPELTMVLANNVLSDPASVSLWYYSEPMLFMSEPVQGVDLRGLLRHSLDYWLENEVSAQGHVNAFGKMYDLYPCTGASVLIAAWDYWTVTRDEPWLRKHLPTLHLMADYLLRRDVDGDGLIEDYLSGNTGTLRDPERANIWFEMMNFGHKNAYANLLYFRAFLCLSEMMASVGQESGAEHYRRHAALLREAYVRQFLSAESGWFVSWISADGKIHDYCHTFINGLAVAYGMVPPAQGRRILSRVVAQSQTIDFDCWHLGVPGNLISCPVADLIRPRIGMDGQPMPDTFGAKDPRIWEEDRFGYRYPNGTIHPTLVWNYLLGLQVAGLDAEADRIFSAMMKSAEEGPFQNGIVNAGYGGAEHFYINGKTCGYEGYLPESFNFLMAGFTRNPERRALLLGPMDATHV